MTPLQRGGPKKTRWDKKTLVKRINHKKDKPQYFPYKLEDFGIL